MSSVIVARVVVFIGLGLVVAAMCAAFILMIATLVSQGQWLQLAVLAGLAVMIVGLCIAGVTHGWDEPWI